MPVADLNGWRYLPKALQRVRETASQVGLTRDERRENMREAFRADPGDVIGKVILVMDDVATTGATLTACSAALKDAGATQVFALTLARALPHHGLKDV